MDRRETAYLKISNTIRCFHPHLVTLLFSQKRLSDRRDSRDQPLFGIALLRRNQSIRDLFLFFQIEKDHARSVGSPVGRELADIDRLNLTYAFVDLPDPCLND